MAFARLTFAPGPDAAPPAAAPGRDTPRHDDLLAVGERRREVDERDVGLRRRAAGAGHRVGHARSLRQAVEPSTTDRADDVDDDAGGGRLMRRALPRRGEPCRLHRCGRAVSRESLSDEGEHDEKRDEQDRRVAPWECLEHVANYGNNSLPCLCRIRAGRVTEMPAMHRS